MLDLYTRLIPRTDACFISVDLCNESICLGSHQCRDCVCIGIARHACDREMKGQLVLALCTSLVLVSGALEHRLHARETDEASGGGKHSHTHNLLAKR